MIPRAILLLALGAACMPAQTVTTTAAELDVRELRSETLALTRGLDELRPLLGNLARSTNASEQRALMGRVVVRLSTQLEEHRQSSERVLDDLSGLHVYPYDADPQIRLRAEHRLFGLWTDDLGRIADDDPPNVTRFLQIADDWLRLAATHTELEEQVEERLERALQRPPARTPSFEPPTR
jgi:hypothetical protein